MNFWFDGKGNLGGFLPSRECPTCGKARTIQTTQKSRSKHFLACAWCKKRTLSPALVYAKMIEIDPENPQENQLVLNG